MARIGRPKAELVLTGDERATLVRWERRRTSAQALALRCRIVLACAEGLSNVEVAERLGVSRPTVGKGRSRGRGRWVVGGGVEGGPWAPPQGSDGGGWYLAPRGGAIVACPDAKGRIRGLTRSQPVLPMMPGVPDGRPPAYVRQGVSGRFAAVGLAPGKVIPTFPRRHRSVEFRKF